MKKEHVSDAVIRRLPRYYRKLTELCERDVEKISSSLLGKEMNVSASQIRQDLCSFGEFGQQGYGYHVKDLCEEIGYILGTYQTRHLIMIGVGNLGHALLQNFPFEQNGFRVGAAFDVSDSVIGTRVNGITVRSMNSLQRYIRSHDIDVAVLAVPQSVAQEVTTKLIDLGVQGFWNFTNIELSSVNPDVWFENIHFADSLLQLKYRILNDLQCGSKKQHPDRLIKHDRL